MKWRMAALILAVSLTGFGPSASAAEETVHWEYSDGFKDAATGRSYYEAYFRSGYDSKFRVIYATTEGDWFTLPKRYWGEGNARPDGTYFLTDNNMIADTVLNSSIYDPSRDHITHKTVYAASTNGNWGLHVSDHYLLNRQLNPSVQSTGKQLIVLIKNESTGLVRKLAFSAYYSGIRWMPDNRILGNVYSEEAKQNEIITIDPATGQTHRLLLATLNGYDPQSGSILFAYNEPTRKNWVYDLKTGAIQAAEAVDLERFTSSSGYARTETVKPSIAPPAGLEPDQLTVSSITDSTIDEAKAVINGLTIGLPNAFLEGSHAWISVQPLLEPFGVQVMKMKDQLYPGTYQLKTGSGSIVIDETNSRNYGGRLFVTKAQLQKLGLHLERVAWVPND